jgi:flagellar biosynthesis/type III secretory pathway protein FliH
MNQRKDLKRIIDGLNSDIQDLVDLVTTEAKNEGFKEGYEMGKSAGYNQGYEEGEKEGKEAGIEEEKKRWESKEKVVFT